MAKALEDQVFPQLEERPAAAKDDIRFEPTQRRVRVMFAGVAIADSRKVMLMLLPASVTAGVPTPPGPDRNAPVTLKYGVRFVSPPASVPGGVMPPANVARV